MKTVESLSVLEFVIRIHFCKYMMINYAKKLLRG